MKFVHPEFLWFLFLIAIPIIIHLFNFRRFKKVYFPNISMLKEVKEETRSQSQLRHILILISRILAISALVFAFAQPFFPDEQTESVEGDRAISIYIDNSRSMEARGTAGRLVDVAKEQAIQIATQFEPTDRFQLLTNDFEGFRQRLVNREEFIRLVEEVEIGPASRPLSQVYTRQRDVLIQSEVPVKKAIALSDFQTHMADFENIEQDSAIGLSLLPLHAESSGNIFIDSIWFETPVRQLNGAEKLHVRVQNETDEQVEVQVSLKCGSDRDLGNVVLPPRSMGEALIPYTNLSTGWQKCVAYVNVKNELLNQETFDDSLYFAYEVAENIPVLQIDAEGTSIATKNFLRSIFLNDEIYQYDQVDERSIDPSSLYKYRLIILNGLNEIPSGLASVLEKFVSNGGTVAVFPGGNIDRNAYMEFLLSVDANYFGRLDSAGTRLNNINYEHPLYENVFEKIEERIDLPDVRSAYSIEGSYRSGEEWIMKFSTGDPFLARYKHNNGQVFLWSVPLDPVYSNLPRHALFVTSMVRIAEMSQAGEPLWYTIGEDAAIDVPSGDYSPDEQLHLVNSSLGFDLIPYVDRSKSGKTTLLVNHEVSGVENNDQVSYAGIYDVMYAGDLVGSVGFNYDRLESILDYVGVGEKIKSAAEKEALKVAVIDYDHETGEVNMSTLAEPDELWKLCLILALVFLAAEIALIKLWKP